MDQLNQAAAAQAPADGFQPGVVPAADGGGARTVNAKLRPFRDPSTDDWSLWRQQFIVVAELRGLNEQQAKSYAYTLMEGPAALAIQDINPRGAETADQMLALYTARFLPAEASELAKADLAMVKQVATEGVLSYHAKIRVLFRRAYPDDANNDAQLIATFQRGLHHAQVREAVMRARPATYAEALHTAQSESAIVRLRQSTLFGGRGTAYTPFNKYPKAQEGGLPRFGLPISGRAPNRRMDEPMDCNAMQPEEGRGEVAVMNNGGTRAAGCWICDGTDHYKRNCPYFKRVMESQQKAAEAGRGRGGRGGARGGRGRGAPRGRGRGGSAGMYAMHAQGGATAGQEEDEEDFQ